MPTPVATVLQIVKNGGAPTSGAITAAYSDTILLKLSDPAGVKKVRYRIWEYPDGFACPAGWTDSGKLYYYVDVLNGGNAPLFSLPSGGGLWGKYMFDATVNDQRRNGVVSGDLYDNTACLQIPSLTGVEDVAFGESDQFDALRQYIAALKGALRILDTAVFTGGGVTDHGALTGLNDSNDHPWALLVSGARALTGDQSAGGHKITNLGTPTAGTDAATKAYVDATSGFDPAGTPSPGQVVKWDGSQPVWANATAYSITAFTATTPVVRVGATVTNPAFTAAHSATPTALALTNTDNVESKDVHATPTSFASSQSYAKSTNNATVSFTITGSDGVSGANRSTSIAWRPDVYWGTGASGGNTEAFIEALSGSALQASRAGSFTVNATGSLKIYWAAPASYGTPTFTVGGFSGGFTLVSSTIAVTNANGVTQDYQLWESNTPGLGSTTVVVS